MDISEDRFKALEERLSHLEEQVKALSLGPSHASPIPHTTVKSEPLEKTYSETENHQNKETVTLLTENWPAKLGVFLILLSLGWFLGYAVIHNWLSDLTRCALCLLASIGVMGWGIYLIPRKTARGEILTILGSTGVILTLWAARVSYRLISPSSTAILMILAIIAISLIALKFRSKPLACSFTVLAMVVPLLINATPNYLGLMSYIFLIDIATLLIFVAQGWTGPLLVSCVATALYQLGANAGGQYFVQLSFAAIFFTLFVMPWIVGILRADQKWETALPKGIFIVVISLISNFFAIQEHLPLFLKSASLIVSGGLVLTFLYFLSQNTKLSHSQITLIWVLSVFTGLCFFSATILVFTGLSQKMMLFAEVWLAILFAHFILKSPVAAQWLAACFIIPIAFSLDIIFVDPVQMKSANFWMLILALIATASSAWILKDAKIDKNFSIYPILFVVAGIYLAWMIWVACHQIMASADTARGIALFIYTLLGVIALIFGKRDEVRKSGLALIAFVVGRLLFVEVWEMTELKRIITFLSVGLLLVLTAFIDRKHKQHVKNPPSIKGPPPPPTF